MTLQIALTTDIATCQTLRRVVFIEEQTVPAELEIDGLDETALHLLAVLDGRPVGCARLVCQGGIGKVGRVCVLADQRGRGLGRAIMRAAIVQFRAMPDIATVTLGAQVQVIAFYERLGFVAEGPVFDDAGIAHREMVLHL